MKAGRVMNDDGDPGEKRRWAGPALFATVLIGVIVFFWWFLF